MSITEELNKELNLGTPNARWEKVVIPRREYYRIRPLSENWVTILKRTIGFDVGNRPENEYHLDPDAASRFLTNKEKHRIGFDTTGDRVIADAHLYKLLKDAQLPPSVVDHSMSGFERSLSPIYTTVVIGDSNQENHAQLVQKTVKLLCDAGLTPRLGKDPYKDINGNWRRGIYVDNSQIREWLKKTRETGADATAEVPSPATSEAPTEAETGKSHAAALGPRTPTQPRPPIEPGAKGGREPGV